MPGGGEVAPALPIASDPAHHRRRAWLGDPTTALIGVLFLALLVVGGALVLAAPGTRAGEVLPLLALSGLYLASGLVAWRRRPHNRVGILMLATGFSIWVTVLADAPTSFLAAVGAITATLPLALTLHLILAFPSGRVQGRLARVLVGMGYLASTLLHLPLVLIGTGPAAVWRPADGASVVAVAGWLQTAVGVSSVLAAAVLVAVRAVRSDPLERRQLGPMVWYRVLLPVVIAVGALAGRVGEPSWVAGLVALQFLGLLGLPVVFLVGLLLGSFGRAGEVDELVIRIGATTPQPGELTDAVASALGDPEALVVYARSDVHGYVDEAGRPVGMEPARGRRLHPVRYNGRVVGGIVHREDLVADHALMEVLGGIVAMGIDGQRSAAEQRALLADLREREADLHASRRRLLQAEDTERRRISRDLHDGAQQHIVLLGLNARRLSRSATDPAVAGAAAGIADGMTGLLADFRDLIAGIMPAPLLDRGLVPAVELLAARMPLPTSVEAEPLPERLPAETESTVYFAVSEALTNVVKHAGATTVRVRFARLGDDATGHRLAVTVADDGTGGADPAGGTGLRGLVDRLAALGGTLRVESSAGAGSVVRVVVPCG